MSLLVASRLNQTFEISCPEAMTIPLTGLSGQALGAADWPEIRTHLTGKEAVVAGPGLGQAKETSELINLLVQESKVPMVLDADALNGLDITTLASRQPGTTILTPHPGEMARLCMINSAEVQANRLRIAAEFSRRHQVVLILKGAGTIVAAPDGRLAINSSGNPGMATGGMGDVLAGLTGSLLGQGLDCWQAACLAVYLHGRAGDLCVQQGQTYGYLASEVAGQIPEALAELY